MITNPKALAAIIIATCLVPIAPLHAQADIQGKTVRPPDAATTRMLDDMRQDRVAPRAGSLPGTGRTRSLLRPIIGAVLTPDDVAGVRISGVTPASGSEKSGLKAGDRITAIQGVEIQGNTGDLRLRNAKAMLSRLKTGSQVQIRYVRDGKTSVAAVTPQVDHTVYFMRNDGSLLRADGNVEMTRNRTGELHISADQLQEMRRHDGIGQPRVNAFPIDPHAPCDNEACNYPKLASVFRWNGLNLASLDGDLGRYFGTDSGVLVLSTGELDGLRAGDVIQRVEGKAVATPREVMAQLRGKGDGDKVAIDYLRERKAGQARIAVPKLAWPAPPAPPAPPKAPTPASAPKAPPPPPAPADAPKAPPAPPAPPRVAIVAVDPFEADSSMGIDAGANLPLHRVVVLR